MVICVSTNDFNHNGLYFRSSLVKVAGDGLGQTRSSVLVVASCAAAVVLDFWLLLVVLK